MVKRCIAFIFTLACLLWLGGCSSNVDRIPMVMVDGVLYLDTGFQSTTKERPEGFDGEITSEVDGSEIPAVDDQSNFGTGYGYQYGAGEGTIDLYMNDKWWIFATEEVKDAMGERIRALNTQTPDF